MLNQLRYIKSPRGRLWLKRYRRSPKALAYQRKYHKTKKAQQTRKAWRQLNREKIQQARQHYYNSPKYKRARKRYVTSRKGKLTLRRYKRSERGHAAAIASALKRRLQHLRLIGVTGLTKETLLKVVKRNRAKFGHTTCEYCLRPIKQYHVDHKTPLIRGGSNRMCNLAISCPGCNRRKHTMTAREFRHSTKINS